MKLSGNQTKITRINLLFPRKKYLKNWLSNAKKLRLQQKHTSQNSVVAISLLCLETIVEMMVPRKSPGTKNGSSKLEMKLRKSRRNSEQSFNEYFICSPKIKKTVLKCLFF